MFKRGGFAPGKSPMLFYLLKTLFVIDVLVAGGLVLFRWALAPQYRGIVSAKVAALALFTPAVALFCGNIYIFCAYLVMAVAFNSRSRAELAGTYLVLLPSMPTLAVETGVGSIYLFAVSAVFAMNLGALIGFAVTQNRRSLTMPRYDVAVVAIGLIFIFIYNRDASVTGLLRGLTVNVLSFLGPYLLISRSIRNRDDVERLLLWLCLGGALTAITALFQALRHWVLFQTYYQALHVQLPMLSWTLALRAGFLRTGGSMVDYSSGGLFLACVLALMPLLRPRFRGIGFWVVLAVLVGGLIATQSRGAWVAAIVGIVAVLAYRGLWGRVVLLAGGAVLAEAMILIFATSGRLAAIAGQTQEASGSILYRKLLASRGMDQIRSHPLFGQSPDQLVANMQDLMQGEHIVDFVNGHLFIMMAAGIPLFLVWCWVWLMPVVEAWRRRAAGGGDLSEALVAIIVPAMVALIFTSPIDRNLTWPTIALALAGPCLTLGRRHRAAQAAARPSFADMLRPRPAMSGSVA